MRASGHIVFIIIVIIVMYYVAWHLYKVLFNRGLNVKYEHIATAYE